MLNPLSISEVELKYILNALINFNLNTYIPFLNRRNGVFYRAQITFSKVEIEGHLFISPSLASNGTTADPGLLAFLNIHLVYR